MIKLSVIIPTFNRRHILERSLAALLAQDALPDTYEVIVVVDGSTDGTIEMLRGRSDFRAVCLVEAQHRGAGAARNEGIRAASGELVLFLDDDLTGVPDLLRQHCAAHSGSKLSVVHGPVFVAPGGAQTIIRCVTENLYESHYGQLDPGLELRFPQGGASSIAVLSSLVNSSMPRDILLNCGGFDEQILAAEDLELGLRLWKMGVLFRCLPTAAAYEHYDKSSLDYLKRQAKALGAGDLLASRKHSEYRQYSRLSGFSEMSVPKRWLWGALACFPVPPVPLVAFPLRFEKRFYRIAPLRRAGIRLLRIAETIASMRGAVRIAGSWENLKGEFDRRLPSLMYHHVGDFRAGTYRAMTVSPKRFEKQIRWLARHGYVGIKPSDWVRWRKEGSGLPDKPVLITFDDAYEDTAEFALPILRRYGFSAVVFVVTGQLGGTNTWDEANGCGTLKLITAEAIRFWAGQGIEFGAHSRTHPDLTKLSEAQCQMEVAESKRELSELLDSPVISFAYPYGAFNDVVTNVVRRHFDLAFSTEEGINHLQDDPHLLNRACVGPDDSLTEFSFIVRGGGLKWYRDWRVRLGLRTRLKRLAKRISGWLPQQEHSD